MFTADCQACQDHDQMNLYMHTPPPQTHTLVLTLIWSQFWARLSAFLSSLSVCVSPDSSETRGETDLLHNQLLPLSGNMSVKATAGGPSKGSVADSKQRSLPAVDSPGIGETDEDGGSPPSPLLFGCLDSLHPL